MTDVRNICVYCGSRPGASPEFVTRAKELGRAMAEANIGLVYGAGSTGIMGAVADAVLEAGGEVTGVIPHGLHRAEITHSKLTTLHMVETMHERKSMMIDLSDAFVAAPGGFGTLEELFEVLTWGQLGIHSKPVGLFNVNGYWDPLLSMLEHCLEQRFIDPFQRELVLESDTPDGLFDALRAYEPHGHMIWQH
jgi:uncharacterized protein (TIGR00730 family)